MSSTTEKIMRLVQALSEEEQRQVLLFVEFLEYKRQRAATVEATFVQTSQDVIQKRCDAH